MSDIVTRLRRAAEVAMDMYGLKNPPITAEAADCIEMLEARAEEAEAEIERLEAEVAAAYCIVPSLIEGERAATFWQRCAATNEKRWEKAEADAARLQSIVDGIASGDRDRFASAWHNIGFDAGRFAEHDAAIRAGKGEA